MLFSDKIRPMNDRAVEIKFLQTQLRQWFAKNRRIFPWRNTRNPYFLFIAEMMLRRTQADQVEPVYEKFVRDFPNPAAALEKPGKARKLLKGLGLEWRADTILKALKQIQQIHEGQIPLHSEKLRSLSGVGEYVSNAILCFSKGAPVPIIDTNTLRVICRYMGIPFRDSFRRNKDIIGIFEKFVDREDARTYNLALIDLAHLVCRPRNPRCGSCPLQTKCGFNRKPQ
jgi:A/G-specific adenine glycosylase